MRNITAKTIMIIAVAFLLNGLVMVLTMQYSGSLDLMILSNSLWNLYLVVGLTALVAGGVAKFVERVSR